MKLSKSFAFRLNASSGVPVYRQLIDQVVSGLAAGALARGDQLPTVRQAAVDLAINPNTVIRAYRELEVRGILETQQGTGTFISSTAPLHDRKSDRERLDGLVDEIIARAGEGGFTLEELLKAIEERKTDEKKGDAHEVQ